MLVDNDVTQSRDKGSELQIYLKYFIFAALAIGIVVFIQLGFILKTFKPYYLIVPVILALALGFLFGHVSILRNRLAHKNQLFLAVADFAQEFTYYRLLDGRYEYASPSCFDLTGYTCDEFYQSPNLMDKLIHPDDVEVWGKHIHKINNAGQPDNLDLRLITKDGKTIWFSHICGSVFSADGKQVGVRSTNINITDRKKTEQRIEHMAYYDSLTDLPNRGSLSKHVDELTKSHAAGNERFALLFLDLDRFKNINDSFHHEFGDHLLVELAQRLKRCCKGRGFVARFGGDEFVVVVENLGDPAAAISYAQELVELVEQPFVISNKELYISGGIGISLFPYDGQDSATLIRNADAAMYRAKKETHSCISLYSKDLIEDATAFITTESRIRQGLSNGEFIPYFQPKVSMKDGSIIGVEALARWQTQDRGMVPPDEFIYIMEETGLILPLGSSMLEAVCKQIGKWSKQGLSIPVAVNISSKQFAHPRFINVVKQVIEEYNVNPNLIEFEITEQAFLEDLTSAVDMLLQLKELGLSIAVDDFGTGYSSLSYLKHLPVDTLKIDRSFAADILNDSRDVAILKAIMSLCNDLELKTVVEGVETQEQAKLLLQLGCTVAQGFLYYEAISAEELTEIISRKNIDT
ncbi:MAG: EAL domain-containing protein [Proteobacteria bacterium]|nr:EAL domain-containing protein [Pseudomonadota bacterium]